MYIMNNPLDNYSRKWIGWPNISAKKDPVGPYVKKCELRNRVG